MTVIKGNNSQRCHSIKTKKKTIKLRKSLRKIRRKTINQEASHKASNKLKNLRRNLKRPRRKESHSRILLMNQMKKKERSALTKNLKARKPSQRARKKELPAVTHLHQNHLKVIVQISPHSLIQIVPKRRRKRSLLRKAKKLRKSLRRIRNQRRSSLKL